MDAIKLCAKNEQEINSLIHTSRIYSNYNKCVKMVINTVRKSQSSKWTHQNYWGTSKVFHSLNFLKYCYKILRNTQDIQMHRYAIFWLHYWEYKKRKTLRMLPGNWPHQNTLTEWASPEESAVWKGQSPSNQPLLPDIHQTPKCFINWLEETKDATGIRTRKLLSLHEGLPTTPRPYRKWKEGRQGQSNT